MLLHTEFPDYPATEIPGVPAGFVDTSWHNDACPSYSNDELGVRIWVNYPHPDDREISDSKRFIVAINDEDALETDSWDDVLEFIATLGAR